MHIVNQDERAYSSPRLILGLQGANKWFKADAFQVVTCSALGQMRTPARMGNEATSLVDLMELIRLARSKVVL